MGRSWPQTEGERWRQRLLGELPEGRDLAMWGDSGQRSRAPHRGTLWVALSWEIEKQLMGVSAGGAVFRGSNRRGIVMVVFKGGEMVSEGLGPLRSGVEKRVVFPGRKPLSHVRGKQEGGGSEEVGTGGHVCPAHQPHEAGQVVAAEDGVQMGAR